MSPSFEDACGAHTGLGAELRGTALLLLERLRVAVEPLRGRTGTEEPGSCGSCPVCAVAAALRGEHSDLAAQLAEHAAGLVTVLAAVLAADGPGAPGAGSPAGGSRAEHRHRPGEPPRPAAAASGRSVQRIVVHRR